MGYKSAFRVRMSDIDDGTLVDVLEAIACFVNEKEPSVGCYPSLETIMRVSRKSKPTVRAAIKALREKGFLSFEQEAGEKRIYYLNLDLLPEAEQKVNRVNNRTDEKSSPGKEVSPVKNFTEEGQKVYPEGGKELTPEGDKNFTPKREENREIEQGSRTRNSLPAQAPWETDHLTNDGKKVEKPKATRAKPKTSCPFSPDDPIPPEYLEYAQAKHPSINAQAEFTKFVNFHLSKDNRFSNWLAAWRTWATKAEEFAKSRPQSQNQTFPFGKPTDPQYGIGVCERPKVLPREYTPEESRRAREEAMKIWNS